jgi:hypothetical protein
MMQLVTYDILRDELAKIVHPDCKWGWPRDDKYVIPSAAWALEFSRWCKAHVPEYKPEGNDCDNRADWMRERAREAREHGGHDDAETAIANVVIGVPPWVDFLNLAPNEQGFRNHETNVIRTVERGWCFIDPNLEGLFEMADAVAGELCYPTYLRL